LTTGVCFLLAIPIAPVVSAVPPLASGPILCLLGALMCSSVRGIDWDDFQDTGAHAGVALPTVGMILWMEEIPAPPWMVKP